MSDVLGAILFFAFFAAAVAGVIVLIIHGIRRERQRVQALRDWAAQRQWTFTDEDPSLVRAFAGFTPFGQGFKRRAMNVLRGTYDGRSCMVFDYEYRTESRDSKGNRSEQIHRHTVHVAGAPVAAPDLVIKPEHFGHKIFDALGGEDIDFESDVFSRKFWVTCRDRKFAYDVVTPALMEFLLAAPKRTWQWRGARMVLANTGRLQANAILSELSGIDAFLDLVPKHVTHGRRAPA